VPLETEFVVFSRSERLWCKARDVASTGMALLSPLPGATPRLYMRIQPPLPDGDAALPIDAVLVREQETPDGYVWGVRFHSLESWVASNIEIYVRKQLAEMIHTKKTSASLSATRAKLQAAAIKKRKDQKRAAKTKSPKPRSDNDTPDQEDGLLTSLYKKAIKRL